MPRRTPLLLFVMSLMLTAFAAGLYVVRYEVFPYVLLSSARKTFISLVEIPPLPDQTAAPFIEFIGSDHLTDPIVVSGLGGIFREYCPDHVDCLAVEYAGRGEVRHAWPYRPEELEKWLEKEEFTADFPYEHAIGFSFLDHASIHGVSSYANGDLLVVFHLGQTHPYGGGVARIDRTGKPLWYRPDFSHHRPHLTDGEVALVPGMRLGKPVNTEIVPGQFGAKIRIDCRRWRHDLVNVIDPAGRLLRETSVFDAILRSPYASLLLHTFPCNPTHVNSVHRLGTDAAGTGLEPGDLVVSIRSLHAFAILDRDTHRLKRMVRGGFMAQHSVLHFEGSRFLLLDNRGGRTADGARMVSRLLMVDAANGEETTIFPNHRTPDDLRELYTKHGGELAISPNRRRVLVTFTQERKAVEVRIADGAVLVVFHSIFSIANGIRYGGDG